MHYRFMLFCNLLPLASNLVLMLFGIVYLYKGWSKRRVTSQTEEWTRYYRKTGKSFLIWGISLLMTWMLIFFWHDQIFNLIFH